MEIEVTNSKNINDGESLIKSFVYGGIFVNDLDVVFLTPESIEEYCGNMMVAKDEGYDVNYSEEIVRLENLINNES